MVRECLCVWSWVWVDLLCVCVFVLWSLQVRFLKCCFFSRCALRRDRKLKNSDFVEKRSRCCAVKFKKKVNHPIKKHPVQHSLSCNAGFIKHVIIYLVVYKYAFFSWHTIGPTLTHAWPLGRSTRLNGPSLTTKLSDTATVKSDVVCLTVSMPWYIYSNINIGVYNHASDPVGHTTSVKSNVVVDFTYS